MPPRGEPAATLHVLVNGESFRKGYKLRERDCSARGVALQRAAAASHVQLIDNLSAPFGLVSVHLYSRTLQKPPNCTVQSMYEGRIARAHTVRLRNIARESMLAFFRAVVDARPGPGDAALLLRYDVELKEPARLAQTYLAHAESLIPPFRIGNHFVPGDPCACLKRSSQCASWTRVDNRGSNFPVSTRGGWPRVSHPMVTWAPRALFEVGANVQLSHPVGENLLEIVAGERSRRGLPEIPVHFVLDLYCDSDTLKVRNPLYLLNTRRESTDWACWNRTLPCG